MKHTVFAVLIGIALVTVFFWGNLTVPAVNYTPTVGTNDLTDLNYPFRYFLSQSVMRGEIPLWSSAISAGYPILAEGQIGGLYPLNLLFAFLPTLTSVNMTIVSTYFLLFLFTYLFLREIRLGFAAALFGATLASFGGFAANEILHFGMNISLSLFVGQLWLLERYLKSKNFAYPLLMGFLLGLSILGGHPQIIFYSLLFLIPYWVVFWLAGGTGSRKKQGSVPLLILSITVFGVIGAGVGAGQLLPQIEFTRNSTRAAGLSAESIERFQFPISNLVTFVRPFSKYVPGQTYEAFVANGWPKDEQYVYMGIIGILFATVGAALSPRLGSRPIFFALAAGTALILSFGTQFTSGYLLQLPPFSFFRLPFRILFLTNFSLAVLAAFAFEQLIFRLSKQMKTPVVVALVAVFLIGGAFIDLRVNAKTLFPEVDANVWFSEPEVASFLTERLQKQERVMDQQYFYATARIYVDQPDLWDDPQIFINLRNLLPNFTNLLYGIPKNAGAANAGGLKITRFNELETEVYFRGLTYREDGVIELADSAAFLNRIMGVRYLLTTRPVEHFLLSKVKEVGFETGQDPVYVYEFFDYYPRILMVPSAETASPEEIKKHLLAVDFDPKMKVFLEEDVDWGAQGGYAANADFEEYTDQEVTISTQASGDGFLFLSDTYYPGWRAYVDGNEANMYRANYAFRAVPVPAGEHTVVFRYEPQSFRWGARITLGAVVATMTVLVVRAVGARKKRNG